LNDIAKSGDEERVVSDFKIGQGVCPEEFNISELSEFCTQLEINSLFKLVVRELGITVYRNSFLEQLKKNILYSFLRILRILFEESVTEPAILVTLDVLQDFGDSYLKFLQAHNRTTNKRVEFLETIFDKCSCVVSPRNFQGLTRYS
jgi:hypothetical protein